MPESRQNARLYTNAGVFIQNRLDLLETINNPQARERIFREIEVMARVMQASK